MKEKGGDERREDAKEREVIRKASYMKGSEGCKGRERWGSREELN